MGGATVLRVLAAILLSGITVKWTRFHSHTYPYSILQPSSYQLLTQELPGKPKTDYYYPALGSYVTNVNVYCDHSKLSATTYLRTHNGQNVHRIAWVTIMGKRRGLIRADFVNPYSRWTIEQVVFSAGGQDWHLTMSYAPQFQNQRPIMLKMLGSFKAESSSRSRH